MDDQLRERLKLATLLPTPSGTAVRIIELARDPELDIGRIAGVLAQDPALTAKVLRVANSPLYGQRRRSDNLRQAVTVLGLNATVTLALSFSLSTCLRERGSDRLDMDTIWRRALLGASAARVLGEHVELGDGEELFLAGLLQDVGIFALEAAAPERYPAHVPVCDQEALAVAERDIFGVDHAEAGAWLLEHWGLPAYLADAVRHSHDAHDGDGSTRPTPFAGCMAVSGCIADVYLGDDPDAATTRAARAAASLLGIDAEALGTVMGRVAEYLPEVESLFESGIVSARDAMALTAQAQELLATRNLQLIQRASEQHERTEDLRRLSERFQESARRDSLTGLYNRGHFDDCLSREFVDATRHGWPLSLAFIDLDNFKLVNDRYGHPSGDRILRNVTRELGRHLRGDGLLARYGGEEFTLLLPGVPAANALGIAERLRETVAAMTHHLDGDVTARTTISVGVATHMEHDRRAASPEDLVRQADRALYLAKRLGRDRVEFAD